MLVFSETGFCVADDTGWGGASMAPAEDCEAIRTAAKKADIVLVFVHGGNEYSPFPSPRMMRLYRMYARSGATAVIGSHPHVPQGYEIYNGVPVFYSLGNFLFPWSSPKPETQAFWYRGFSVELKFSGSKISSFNILPTSFSMDTGFVNLMENPERKKFLAYINKLSSLLRSPHKIDELWSGWCAMQGHKGWLEHIITTSWPAKTKKQLKQLVALDHMIHCEAHNELGQTFLKLVRNKKLSQAKKHIAEVRKLMKGYL